MEKSRNKLYILLICAGLVLGTLVAYAPLRHCGFVDYDDVLYITDNPQVQKGLQADAILWALQTGRASNWHPLTWMSHMLDYELFGLNPLGHHGSNLLLHILNTLLLFGLLWRMTRRMWPSALVAAWFAWHPLHVQSVAWIAERKDVLSTFFGLLSLWAYAAYAQRGGLLRFLLTAVFLALGLTAKPMLVTLPFVMLLLDYWPLRRIQINPATETSNCRLDSDNLVCPGRSLRYLLMEKVPLFMLAAASCAVTFLAQRSGGAVDSVENMPIYSRGAVAVVAYVGYITKMFWPRDLSILYLHPNLPGGVPVSGAQIFFAAVLLLVISLRIFWARQKRYLLMGWLWYLGTLVPVIGLVQVGMQAMADRYTYIPLIGLFIIIAWGAAELLNKHPRQTKLPRWAAGFLAAATLAAAIICTQKELRYWQGSVTLYTRALEVNPRNRIIHHNLAYVLNAQGKLDEAVSHYTEVINIKPTDFKAHFNLANVFRAQDRLDEAVRHYRRALQIDSNSIRAHYTLGVTLRAQGKFDEAIESFRRALQIEPYWLSTLNDAAWLIATTPNQKQSVINDAIRWATRAAELTQYKDAKVLDILAAANATAGNFDQAQATARTALTLALQQEARDLAEDIRKRLELYQQQKPYR